MNKEFTSQTVVGEMLQTVVNEIFARPVRDCCGVVESLLEGLYSSTDQVVVRDATS